MKKSVAKSAEAETRFSNTLAEAEARFSQTLADLSQWYEDINVRYDGLQCEMDIFKAETNQNKYLTSVEHKRLTDMVTRTQNLAAENKKALEEHKKSADKSIRALTDSLNKVNASSKQVRGDLEKSLGDLQTSVDNAAKEERVFKRKLKEAGSLNSCTILQLQAEIETLKLALAVSSPSEYFFAMSDIYRI